MTFPRLYAQYQSHPPVELHRGEIRDETIQEMKLNMGQQWRLWIDYGMSNPEGAHFSHTPRRGRPMPTGALTREEKQALPQNDFPWAINAPVRPRVELVTEPDKIVRAFAPVHPVENYPVVIKEAT